MFHSFFLSYGFKKHISVDMQSGLINKVALTPANITDAKDLKHVLPSSGAIYADTILFI
jgi:IS5 family transposase